MKEVYHKVFDYLCTVLIIELFKGIRKVFGKSSYVSIGTCFCFYKPYNPHSYSYLNRKNK